jgi:hypothetical protein
VITQEGEYTAPNAAGTFMVTATSKADDSKSDSATVTVRAGGFSVLFTSYPKALFVGDTALIAASAPTLANPLVTWHASHGAIPQAASASASFTAPASVPPGDAMAVITATSVQDTSIAGIVNILIRALDMVALGTGNSSTNPQLLDLANAFGSRLPNDLAKYDLNGDGAIDDDDLIMLFKKLGWRWEEGLSGLDNGIKENGVAK